MQRPGVLLATAFLLPLLAGCLSDSDGPGGDAASPAASIGDQWARLALTDAGTDDQHDHQSAVDHEGFTTPNWELLGWDPISTAYHGRPAGGYYCGDLAETEGRDIAVYHSFSTDVALVIVDVTNRSDPELIGELVLPLTHVYDAAVTEDGRYALLATDPDTGGVDLPPTLAQTYRTAPLFRDACGNEFQGPEENLPLSPGVVLVDLADPTQPVVADFDAQPVLGVHSINSATVDGVTYVVASTTNLVHGTSYYGFYTLGTLPVLGTPNLDLYGVYQAQSTAVEDTEVDALYQVNGHVDAKIHKHPVTGQVLAYLANWNGGIVLLELVSPGVIQPVGSWNDYVTEVSVLSGMTGQWHSVTPADELRNGRHLTAIGQEILGRPSNRPTSQAVLLDTTDPANPKAVARWTLPVDVDWTGASFSTHYVDMIGDTLFTTMYHGGVWAADLSEEHWPNLPSIGVFVPNAQPETSSFSGPFSAPLVQDINHLDDGTIVVLDAGSGAYTVRFDPEDPRVPAIPGWTEDDWQPDA